MGAVASVFVTPSVQYFCAIDEAQFLKESSFDIVAKFVEFVQIVSADAPFGCRIRSIRPTFFH